MTDRLREGEKEREIKDKKSKRNREEGGGAGRERVRMRMRKWKNNRLENIVLLKFWKACLEPHTLESGLLAERRGVGRLGNITVFIFSPGENVEMSLQHSADLSNVTAVFLSPRYFQTRVFLTTCSLLKLWVEPALPVKLRSLRSN